MSDFTDKYKLEGSVKHYAKSLLSAGTKEEEVLALIKPYMGSHNLQQQQLQASSTCPACKSIMRQVTLANDRPALYCPKDRVTLPV